MRRRDPYLDHLARVPMFSTCSRDELATIARHADVIAFEAGKVLIREGQLGQEFWVIGSGKVRVERSGSEVNLLGPGDFAGELALLDPGPRNATVVAATDGEAIVIGRREFFGLLAEAPGLTAKLLQGMARRLHALDSE